MQFVISAYWMSLSQNKTRDMRSVCFLDCSTNLTCNSNQFGCTTLIHICVLLYYGPTFNLLTLKSVRHYYTTITSPPLPGKLFVHANGLSCGVDKNGGHWLSEKEE